MKELLQKKAAELEKKRGELKTMWDGLSKTDGAPVMDVTKIAEFNQRNEELEGLQKEYNDLSRAVKFGEQNEAELKEFGKPADQFTQPAGGADLVKRSGKSIGELFTESAAFTQKGAKATLKDVSVKTLLQTTAGFAPEIVRNRPVLLTGQPALNILDVIPMRDVTQPGIKYMEESPIVNAASETNEGNAYHEATFAFTEKDSSVRKITVWIPVTDEQLEDVEYMRQYLNDRLPLQLRQRIASQVIVGTGATVGGNATLRGLMNFVGIQTQAKGADPVFDALLKGYTKIRGAAGGYSNPTHTIINEVDEQNVRLLRTADGRYIMGDPGSQPANISVFGVPLVVAVQKPAGTSFTKDMSFSEMAVYRDVEMQITNAHADFFINGKQAVRADVRVLFHDYRPASGCEVTGL